MILFVCNLWLLHLTFNVNILNIILEEFQCVIVKFCIVIFKTLQITRRYDIQFDFRSYKAV